MRLRHFDYRTPEHLIAQQPLKRRDQARLMVINRHSGEITHDIFANLQRYLPPQSCLVLNNTKVIPARLLGRRATGAEVEIFLLKKLSDGYSYETLLRPLKRLKAGEQITFNGGGIVAEIQDKERRIVRFNRSDLNSVLAKIGHMPLPPYIKRQDRASDRRDYQTVYARREGSVAAPTAGLHFTRAQLAQLKRQGHDAAHVTLHVNYGTFKPVETEDITRHPMHAEDYAVTRKAYMAIQKAKNAGRKIVAVGTTSCRVLETVVRRHDLNRASKKMKYAIRKNAVLSLASLKIDIADLIKRGIRGETNLFVYPGFDFKMVDILVTNFHLPRTTLLMLVYAFGGMELMKKAYREAVREKYRFYSYGDAMVIL